MPDDLIGTIHDTQLKDALSERYLASIPLGRFGEPEEIAGAFLYLADPANAYVTGQVLCADGGLYMVS